MIVWVGSDSPRFVSSTATRWVVVLLFVAAMVAGLLLQSDQRRRPNVVLIITDDQHPAALDYMPTVLADLAGHGIRFDDAFASTPICAPSRASIFTGRYPSTHGVIANGMKQKDGSIGNGAFAFDASSTLATWLQAAGYKTALLGKYLNQYQFLTPVVPPGWDDWRVFAQDINVFFDYDLNENGRHVHYGKREEDYSTDVLARHAVDFIERNQQAPWFMVFAPFAPHDPSEPAPRHRGKLEQLPEWRPPNWNELGTGKPNWLERITKNVSKEGLAARTRRRIGQLESLLAVDDAVGSILAALEKQGVADDTMVIFTADHGLAWGEHRWAGKQLPYEEIVRIPLIARYPARWPEARRLDDLVLNVDIAPTIVELAGATPNGTLDGKSFVDLLDGAAPEWRQEVVLRHFRGGFLVPPWDAIRTSRHKYVRSGRSEELYDLEQDPYELDNRAKKRGHQSIRKDLAKRLADALAERRE